jgi:uncharacterized GH25 family protein
MLSYTISDVDKIKIVFNGGETELMSKTTDYKSGGLKTKTKTYYLGIRKSAAKTWSTGRTGSRTKATNFDSHFSPCETWSFGFGFGSS